MFVAAAALFLVGVAHAVDWNVTTPLDDYVNRPDPTFAYFEVRSYRHSDSTTYIVNLTSQTWMDADYSDRSIWRHWLTIAIPDNVRFNDALYLRVGAGNNGDDMPGEGHCERIGNQSSRLGAVAAELRQVPNQPIVFTNDPIERVEDFIIGYTWRMFIEHEGDNPNPDVVLQLPMVKSAKLAVDAIVDFVNTRNPNIRITRYMPSGYSKRGWVSALLACVDRRVFATVPIVITAMNYHPNLHHHYRSLGGWSWAFFPYWSEDVSRYIDHPRSRVMASFIDPYDFRERLTMPKLVIAASSDQFFLPDDTHYFWDALLEPKYYLIVENTDHGFTGKGEVAERNTETFFVGVLTGFNFPSLSWQRNETATTGTIVFQTDRTPDKVTAWMADATHPVRRDFRESSVDEVNDITWEEYEVNNMGNNQYFVEFNKREDTGYRCFFITSQYPGPEGIMIDRTSEVNIIPDTMPYPQCQGEEECAGFVV